MANNSVLYCPCCGGQGKYVKYDATKTHYYTVRCMKCGLETARYTSRLKAKAAWNRRVKNE